MNRRVSAIAVFAAFVANAFSMQQAGAWTIAKDFDNDSTGSLCGGLTESLSTIVTTVAVSGTKSCAMKITAGATGWEQFGGVVWFPSNLTAGSQVWVRIRSYMPVGFNYDASPYLKFLRMHTAEGYDDLYIYPAGSQYPYWWIFEGEDRGVNVGTQADRIVLGKWETYEMYIRFDSVSTANGGRAMVRLWKNGKLLAEIKDRITLRNANSFADRLHLSTYWNGGAPATQQMYIDDLVLTSDTPAGRDEQGNPYVGDSGKIPAPPQAVSVQ